MLENEEIYKEIAQEEIRMLKNNESWDGPKYNELNKKLYTDKPTRHYGWYDYVPIANFYEKLYEATNLWPPIVYSQANEFITQIRHRPELVYEITPRQFELVIADVFLNRGFEVELTPASHDGGVDIYVRCQNEFGPLLYVVECKQYSRDKKVGIGVVQRIYGVAQNVGANKGVVVTTSSFTKPAVTFAAPLLHSLSLNDYNTLANWLREFPSA
jgi:hypothetical protein